jgi:hypothetical protein
MFWLVEGKDKFKEFCNRGFEEGFVEIISSNHFQHPVENFVCAFYVRPIKETKGYILPITHSECINLEYNEVIEELSNWKKIYVRDKKEFLHYLPLKQLFDITLHLPPYIPPLTQAHNFIYRNHPSRVDTNAIVPITKHYEVCEQVYEDLEHRINQPINQFYNNKATLVFNAIERNGIKIDKNEFEQHFHQVEGEFVFTSYNFKTLTTRPSNKFNGVNYAALSHKDGSRKSFIPRNDKFVEFDISAYHPNLAARLVDFEFDDVDVHRSFANMYGVDYKKAKELTFKQLYGGVFEQYKDLEFFKRVQVYIDDLWASFQEHGWIECPISGYQYCEWELENMNPQKLFNYVLQNLETATNIGILWEIIKLLQGKNTKLVLYTYDSFLFDLDENENELLISVLDIFKKHKLQVKHSYGNNYDFREA